MDKFWAGAVLLFIVLWASSGKSSHSGAPSPSPQVQQAVEAATAAANAADLQAEQIKQRCLIARAEGRAIGDDCTSLGSEPVPVVTIERAETAPEVVRVGDEEKLCDTVDHQALSPTSEGRKQACREWRNELRVQEQPMASSAHLNRSIVVGPFANHADTEAASRRIEEELGWDGARIVHAEIDAVPGYWWTLDVEGKNSKDYLVEKLASIGFENAREVNRP